MTSPAPTRLLADIGGTNARFALSIDGVIAHEIEYFCANFPDLVAAAETYLAAVAKQAPRPTQGSLSIAGPVQTDAIAMTNHPWRFSVQEIRQQLRFDRLIAMNDFTALALAIRHLPPEGLRQVGGGAAKPHAPIALLGAGTGLGVSGLIPATGATPVEWVPLQGEGGHVNMPVTTARELAVLGQLQARFGHVSAERVLSGPGIVNLYSALCAIDDVTAKFTAPADITREALTEGDALCSETLQVFCALLGTVAANLVLTLGAHGGVYIGGGIVPRLGHYFTASSFRARFEDKGRYRNYLAAVPAYVIEVAQPAFIGLQQSFAVKGPRVESVG